MKLIKTSLFIGMIAVIIASCKKSDSDDDNSYPKNVSITYRVTSAAIDNLILITYYNETGGISTENDPRLPFTKTINRIVNKYDNINMGYFVNPAKVVKMEILVNNQVVKSQENNSANASMGYTFE